VSLALDLLLVGLRHVVRPRLRRAHGPLEARRAFDRAAAVTFRAPPFLCRIKDRAGLDRIHCGPRLHGKIILYFHGGGYVAGGPHTHAAMLGQLSGLSQLEVCAPAYPLAPEHPFPAAFEGAVASWEHLMAAGYAPSDVVLGGDSAGGGLALALLSYLCHAATPPAAAFAMSPWCDLSLSGDSLQGIVFEVGREHFGKENMRNWFKALYEVLLGASQGPRFGGFVALYGVDETVALIDKGLAGELG